MYSIKRPYRYRSIHLFYNCQQITLEMFANNPGFVVLKFSEHFFVLENVAAVCVCLYTSLFSWQAVIAVTFFFIFFFNLLGHVGSFTDLINKLCCLTSLLEEGHESRFFSALGEPVLQLITGEAWVWVRLQGKDGNISRDQCKVLTNIVTRCVRACARANKSSLSVSISFSTSDQGQTV